MENEKLTLMTKSGKKLVAQLNKEFDEIQIFVETKDGLVEQDLTLARIKNDGNYEVLVWANADDEDYTNRYDIKPYEEPKHNDEKTL